MPSSLLKTNNHLVVLKGGMQVFLALYLGHNCHAIEMQGREFSVCGARLGHRLRLGHQQSHLGRRVGLEHQHDLYPCTCLVGCIFLVHELLSDQ